MQCPYCNRTKFADQTALTSHQQNAHGIEPRRCTHKGLEGKRCVMWAGHASAHRYESRSVRGARTAR